MRRARERARRRAVRSTRVLCRETVCQQLCVSTVIWNNTRSSWLDLDSSHSMIACWGCFIKDQNKGTEIEQFSRKRRLHPRPPQSKQRWVCWGSRSDAADLIRGGMEGRRWWKMKRSQRRKKPSFYPSLANSYRTIFSKKRSTVQVHVRSLHACNHNFHSASPSSSRCPTVFWTTLKLLPGDRLQSDRPEQRVDGIEAKPLMSWSSWCNRLTACPRFIHSVNKALCPFMPLRLYYCWWFN